MARIFYICVRSAHMFRWTFVNLLSLEFGIYLFDQTLAKTTFTLDDWFNMRGILNRRWLLLMSVVVGRIWSGKKITFESSNICIVLKFVCVLWLRYFFRENLKKIWIHENNWQMNLFFTTDSSKALSLLLEGETWAWSLDW